MIYFKRNEHNKEFTDIFICDKVIQSIKLEHPKEMKSVIDKIDRCNFSTRELDALSYCLQELQLRNEYKKYNYSSYWNMPEDN
jgi:hypothetical protein